MYVYSHVQDSVGRGMNMTPYEEGYNDWLIVTGRNVMLAKLIDRREQDAKRLSSLSHRRLHDPAIAETAKSVVDSDNEKIASLCRSYREEYDKLVKSGYLTAHPITASDLSKASNSGNGKVLRTDC